MGFSHDTDDIMREIREVQAQLAGPRRTDRLMSPEHIAYATGYVLIKNDLNEINQGLAELNRRVGGG